ncbi:MAG: cytochrome c oxidase subunit [Solirubrobacteraceae bacterium]|jgi:cytochrome c oxidase subunit 2|nr:cytochrome c oxidase subunit [Solirubrobacteraceae bacterium]
MNGERPTAREAPVHVARLAIIGIIASALGIALALLIHWFPVSAATQAKPIDTLWDVLLIVSVPIFVLVTTVVLYSVYRWRMRPGEELLDGPPIHGNTRLEVVWTAVPAILLVALCSYAYAVLHDVEEAKADSMEVRVVGEQFAWTFYYRDGGKELSSHELYLPLNRPVHFTIQSKDVLHDFWVPAFRVKKDAVRGINTDVRATPNRIGTYPVVCAELCGLGHAAMRATVHVVQPQQFNAWLGRLRGGGGAQAGAGGTTGGAQASTDAKTLFTTAAQPVACGSCHTLAEAGTNGTTGPNLDQVLKGKSASFIKQSIEQPDAQVAKGYTAGIMPKTYAQSLKPAQVDALVKYLQEVTK